MHIEVWIMINTILHKVWLQENRIRDPGIRKLLGVLGCNQVIKKVFLEYNQIGEAFTCSIDFTFK